MATDLDRKLAIRREAELAMLRALSPSGHMEAALRIVAGDNPARVHLVTAHLLLAQLKNAGVEPDPGAYDAALEQRTRAIDEEIGRG